MSIATEGGPFSVAAVSAIHLPRAPLVRVLAQVVWLDSAPMIAAFSSISEKFAVLVAEDYPFPGASPVVQFNIEEAGRINQQDVPPVQTYTSADGAWTLYLSTTFLTLETRSYTTREDMLGRFERALQHLDQTVDVPPVVRVGFRYVNRVSDPEDYKELDNLVNKAVLGEPVPLPTNVIREHSITQALFRSPGGGLSTKWAHLPANVSHDPSIEGASHPSWVLDLDAFDETRRPFDVRELTSRTQELSSLAYQFFRWAVKEEFLTRFGAAA